MTAATDTDREQQAMALKERIDALVVDMPNGLTAMELEQQTAAARMLVDWLHERFPACRTQ